MNLEESLVKEVKSDAEVIAGKQLMGMRQRIIPKEGQSSLYTSLRDPKRTTAIVLASKSTR